MPIYEYKCCDCEKTFSLLQKMGTSVAETCCTKCGSERVKRMVSSFSCSNQAPQGIAPPASSGFGGT